MLIQPRLLYQGFFISAKAVTSGVKANTHELLPTQDLLPLLSIYLILDKTTLKKASLLLALHHGLQAMRLHENLLRDFSRIKIPK